MILINKAQHQLGLASLVAQRVKRLPTMWETQVRFLSREDPLEKEMATHSGTLAWKIPWMEKPLGYPLWGWKESDLTSKWKLSISTDISNSQDNLNSAMQKHMHICKKSKIFSYLRSILKLTPDGRLRWRPQRNNRARGRTQAGLLTSLPTRHTYSPSPSASTPNHRPRAPLAPLKWPKLWPKGLGDHCC